MTPPHIFPAESIMGIIPSRPTHAIAGRLIRNSSAHTLIAARHEDGVLHKVGLVLRGRET